LVAVWNAAPEGDFGRIVKLLMLTGQRRDEIADLRWAEIVDDMIALPAGRTKNSRAHEVPLSPQARLILNDQPQRVGRERVFGYGEGGFSGISRAKSKLDKASGVADWTLHDLRRTMATRMADLGVQPHIIEPVLNHVSGHKGGVAGIYNRSTYATEKRAALDLWSSHAQTLLASAEGANVTMLKRA
jgi:integrase